MIRTLVGVGIVSLTAAASASAQNQDSEQWPHFYVVGRSGFTFGTRTAPLIGAEVGGQITPFLQAYGAFDWHRDVSPSAVEDLSGLVSSLVGADVNYRLPSFIGTGGLKVLATRGRIRPYGVGGFGYGRVKGTVEIEGKDVTGLMNDLGFLDRDDITFNKALFEIGGGISMANGPMYIDVSYRFRRFFDTGEPINMSGVYVGAGLGF